MRCSANGSGPRTGHWLVVVKPPATSWPLGVNSTFMIP
ncbi:MAG: hypothetical protein RL153_1117, partial [Verrucomicrobiota bacterium]